MKDDAVGVEGDQLSVGIVPTHRHEQRKSPPVTQTSQSVFA